MLLGGFGVHFLIFLVSASNFYEEGVRGGGSKGVTVVMEAVGTTEEVETLGMRNYESSIRFDDNFILTRIHLCDPLSKCQCET